MHQFNIGPSHVGYLADVFKPDPFSKAELRGPENFNPLMKVELSERHIIGTAFGTALEAIDSPITIAVVGGGGDWFRKSGLPAINSLINWYPNLKNNLTIILVDKKYKQDPDPRIIPLELRNLIDAARQDEDLDLSNLQYMDSDSYLKAVQERKIKIDGVFIATSPSTHLECAKDHLAVTQYQMEDLIKFEYQVPSDKVASHEGVPVFLEKPCVLPSELGEIKQLLNNRLRSRRLRLIDSFVNNSLVSFISGEQSFSFLPVLEVLARCNHITAFVYENLGVDRDRNGSPYGLINRSFANGNTGEDGQNFNVGIFNDTGVHGLALQVALQMSTGGIRDGFSWTPRFEITDVHYSRYIPDDVQPTDPLINNLDDTYGAVRFSDMSDGVIYNVLAGKGLAVDEFALQGSNDAGDFIYLSLGKKGRKGHPPFILLRDKQSGGGDIIIHLDTMGSSRYAYMIAQLIENSSQIKNGVEIQNQFPRRGVNFASSLAAIEIAGKSKSSNFDIDGYSEYSKGTNPLVGFTLPAVRYE